MEDRQVSLKQVLDTVDEMPIMKDNNGMEFIEKSLTKTRIRLLPSVQPEPYEDKLKEIADALSEKMCYMNTCPNERDIILGYLGRKRSNKNHCNTDCWNEKCESYHYETKQQPEPCEDAIGVTLHVAKISKRCSDFSDLDEVIECEDVVSRTDVKEIVSFECGEWRGLAKTIIKKIEDIPTVQPEQRWIPCSERLPEKPNMYTVTDSKGDVVRFIFTGTESSKKYWRRCAKAWMPLPEPYVERRTE